MQMTRWETLFSCQNGFPDAVLKFQENIPIVAVAKFYSSIWKYWKCYLCQQVIIIEKTVYLYSHKDLAYCVGTIPSPPVWQQPLLLIDLDSVPTKQFKLDICVWFTNKIPEIDKKR